MTQRQGRHGPWALVFGICVSAVIAAVIAGLFPALLFWFLAGWTIGVAAHELGHATGAAVAAIPVYRVVIGGGPLLWRSRIRHAAIEVRGFPVTGCVMNYPSANDRGGRRLVFVAGGPMANLAVIGLLQASQSVDIPQPVADALDAVTIAQVIIIACSLWPMQSRGGASDGTQLLRLLWSPDRDHGAAALPPALAALGLPDTAASLRLLLHFHKLGGDAGAEALDDLRHELAGRDLTPGERAQTLDLLVTRGLVTADPVLRPHLDAWSQALVALEPDRPTRWGSRGSVLVELGRCREGKALLAPLAAPDQPPFDAFMSRAWIAFAEHRLGNTAAARQFADAARATTGIDPATAATVLARLEEEIPPAVPQAQPVPAQ